jgi:hypothetical protein
MQFFHGYLTLKAIFFWSLPIWGAVSRESPVSAPAQWIVFSKADPIGPHDDSFLDLRPSLFTLSY